MLRGRGEEEEWGGEEEHMLKGRGEGEDGGGEEEHENGRKEREA
jgi:hypothetical protein